MTEVIRIISAVVDTQQLTLYKEDGSSIIIPQGDARIRPLVDMVVPELEANGFCDIDLTETQLENYYAEAEKSMNGFIRFFRAAKTQIDEILARFGQMEEPVAPLVAGAVPQTISEAASNAPVTRSSAAVAEIMANATTSAEPSFAENDEKTTVVAVLEDNTVIPGVEAIGNLLEGVAAKLGNPIGVENFFRRVATVKRNHTVQDLLKFMQKGELPIADDGSILVYKRLESTGQEGVFRDCHSKKVMQRVGSYVFMDEKLVDPNRHQDCSNGLHVARRDYLRTFSGDVTVLAKLAPEDVIAVPHSDARKLRAKGYHIIAQLSKEDAAAVCSDRPMTDKVLLGNAIAGNHIGILEHVQITEQKGGGLIITAMDHAEVGTMDESITSSSLDSLEEVRKENQSVDAAAVASDLGKAHSAGMSVRQAKAAELYLAITNATTNDTYVSAAKALMEFKKKAKVSWDKLGIDAETAEFVAGVAEGRHTIPEVAAEEADAAPLVLATEGTGTPRQRIRNLLDGGTLTADVAKAVIAIKAKAKKSWTALGVSSKEEKNILKLAGK
jgi:hypothetical protein